MKLFWNMCFAVNRNKMCSTYYGSKAFHGHTSGPIAIVFSLDNPHASVWIGSVGVKRVPMNEGARLFVSLHWHEKRRSTRPRRIPARPITRWSVATSTQSSRDIPHSRHRGQARTNSRHTLNGFVESLGEW